MLVHHFLILNLRGKHCENMGTTETLNMLQFPCRATSWQCVLCVATDRLATSRRQHFSHLQGKGGTWCLKTEH